jgi:hypothetical protein
MAGGIYARRTLATRRDRRNEALMEIRIYFEGKATLTSGFESFFTELRTAARVARSTIQFVAAKDGIGAYRKASRTHAQAWNILLKDSEQPMPTNALRLCERHGINPEFVDRAFWMVELMETWFLADRDTLASYYGDGFLANAIGETADVEQVSKAQVLDRLKRATTKTSKGEYDKVKYAPYLLEKLDSNRVRLRAEHCRQLFESVIAKLGQTGN